MKFLQILSFVIIAASISSCKKENNNSASTSGSSTSITLATPSISDNLVHLSWSKLNTPYLRSYIVARVPDTLSPQTSVFFTVDKDITEFIDTLPMTPYVQYYVVASISSSSGAVITSNKINHTRSETTFMAFAPMDALIDRTTHLAYIYSISGDIAIYDLQNKSIVKQISTQATLGYCDMATYNGKKELYVPRNDGWLFIYDASTLEQIDQIHVASQLFSVAANNGMLYINGSASSSGSTIICCSRSTKTQVSTVNSTYNARLKLIQGTNSEFIGISQYNESSYYRFDNAGVFVSQQSGSLSSYYLSNSIFEMFPNGSSFISGASGVIASKSLSFITSLPHGNMSFTTFDFDNSHQLIYTGTTTKSIQTYSMVDYQLTKTTST